MVSVDDTAPDFTAPLALGDISEFTLSERVEEAPLVLAFFPGAFSGTCTSEMAAFEDRIDEFEDLGATLYGVSVDLPWALQEFRTQGALSFGLISDTNRRVVDAYDLRTDFLSMGVEDLAQRAVLVVDADRVVRYAWVTEDAGIEPDYDEVLDAVADLAD
ncbi:MAG: redoxin domain-containing protein [Haloarculaceae archaeon]